MPAAHSTGRRRSRFSAGSACSSGYALLGATWLVMKTEGPVADARARTGDLACCTRCCSSWQPSAFGHRSRFRASRALVLAAEFLFPVAGAAAHRAHRLRRVGGVAHGARDACPLWQRSCCSCLGFLGLVISAFPYLVPPSLTIWQTAAAPSSQTFMLVGTLFLLPLILAYTAYVYWLFRGKISPGERLSLSGNGGLPACAAGSCPSRRASAACGPGNAAETPAALRARSRETPAATSGGGSPALSVASHNTTAPRSSRSAAGDAGRYSSGVST